MSGLLPRTPEGGQSGAFTDLVVQTLTVSLAGFINALTANSMSVGSLDVSSITTPLINGDPNLNIVATTASVGGDTIATLTAAQTLTTKTLIAPVIATISNTGTVTVPSITTTLMGRNTTDTMTNKTIDSAGTGNAITITSGSLVATNINDVLNQGVKTTNAVTFATVTTQSVLVNTAVNDGVTVRSSTPQNNQILFEDAAITSQTGIGYDVLNSLHRFWGYLNSPMVFATNNLERLRIPSGGIANDNSITNILGLSGTSLFYKNNVVDTSTTQTLSGKTLTAPVISTISNTGTLTLPVSTDTLVGRATVDTLSNKTLTAPVISTISNTGTLTLPTSSDTLVGRATTDTLENKTLIADTCIFQDNAVAGRQVKFELGGSNLLELRSSQTADHIQIFPNAAGDILVDGAAQSPTFTALNLTNGVSAFAGNIYESSGTTSIAAGGANVTVVTLATASSHTYLIKFITTGYATTGTDAGKGNFQRTYSGVTNNAGTLDVDAYFANSFALNGIVTAGQSVTSSGTNVIIAVVGNAIDDITFRWYVQITVN